ncbi:helix-turn-helix domain-containing protein [Corynebacterium sp. A21]|uniref:helix-turn-helix domain-containing protein n=1 Tax=Corynebacterium sp. A21 TaxID=3457318 RepID=UPI003FD39046
MSVQQIGITAAGPRARDAFILRLRMRGQWLIDVRDRTPLSVISPLRGPCVVRRGTDSVALAPFELALVAGSGPYEVLRTEEDTEPSVYTVLPSQKCLGPDGRHVDQELRHGLRTWGNDLTGPDEILVGSYTSISSVAELLLGTSALIRVPDQQTRPWVELLATEAGQVSPVHAAVLDRLLDIVTLRALETVPAVPGGITDPGINAAVAVIWETPAQKWTVAQLADIARMSRSAFAVAFREALGDTPASYLTSLRLALASDALRDTDSSLDQIAREVGYSTGFALSEAFRRELGIRPSELRVRR